MSPVPQPTLSRSREGLNPLLQRSVPYLRLSILLRRVDRGGLVMDAPLAEIFRELLADELRAIVGHGGVWKSCSYYRQKSGTS